jgi:CheY-like chemotaxis protein
MAFRVLLVEPDPGLAEEIRRAFEPVGFSVTAVVSGEQAVERCREEQPDLILLAAELPDMSGFSVCNRLRRTVSGIPLLLYTAEATDAAIEAHRATRTRADDYLKKPFEMAELLGRAAGLLHGEALPPPAPQRPAPPAAPRGARRPPPPEGEVPPVLQRVPSSQVASRGFANAMAAASRAPPEPKAPPPPPRGQAAPRGPVPVASPPAAAPRPPAMETPPFLAPPSPAPAEAPPGAAAPRSAPPPVPPAPPLPASGARATLAKLRVKGPRPDPTDILAEWPRDPSPPKGTPDEKLEYFRDRLRARDAFLAKVRDVLSQLKGEMAELAGERDVLQESLAAEVNRSDELTHRLQEAGQDAAALNAQLAEARKKLEESETTRASLSDVLNESMQQHEASDQTWSARVAAAEEARAQLEAELAEARDSHARMVATLEADRADERARLEGARAEAESAAQGALSHMEEERQAEREGTAARMDAAAARIDEVTAEREALEAERERLASILAQRDQSIADAEARAADERQEARAEADSLRAQLEELQARVQLGAGEKDEAQGRVADLEAELERTADARTQLDQMLRQARAETQAHEEKALAAEHAFHAKAAELVAAENRIDDLTQAIDEGRATAEGARGELARLESGRADAERRAAEAIAARDQLAREGEASRRATEGERDRLKRLEAEVQRLAKLEPVAEEAARLRKEVTSLREMVQHRTQVAESASRQAQSAAAERAKVEERMQVEAGRLQGGVSRLEADLTAARRRLAEVEAERNARAAELARARAELEHVQVEAARLGEVVDERQKAASAQTGSLELRHQAEVARLKAAMVELEKHLESRARNEMAAKKRIQELEKAAAARPAAAEPADMARLKDALQKVSEEVEELRGENEFLNGEVARYLQKNKDLQTQISSLKEA